MSNKALNVFGSNSQYLDSDEQQPSLYSSPEEWGRWLSSRLPHFPIGEVKLSTAAGPIHRGKFGHCDYRSLK